MVQRKQPGYPLPDGELGEDEIVCQLVYLPDRPEYWQAFLGAYHYLSTWRAWERDEDKRGKDAASNWREAFELTMECWRMACLEQLQQDVSDILAHLRTTDACCSDIITYNNTTIYNTIIVFRDGDPPEFYGETEVEDWDEWGEYLCHNANLWVDELKTAAYTIETALETGGISIGLIAAVLAAIAFFVVGGVLALPVLLLIVFGLSVGVSSTIFQEAQDDIEDAREAIVCDIIHGNDLAGAVETALGSGTAWDTLYQFIDYDSARAVLYEGGDGETWLEAERDTSCNCEGVYVLDLIPPGYQGIIVDETHVTGTLFSSCWRVCQLRVLNTLTGFHVPWRLLSVELVTPGCVTGNKAYTIVDHFEQILYEDDPQPPETEDCGYICINSSVLFTNLEILWEIM